MGEVLGLIFAGYVPLASQSPYPIIVYFVANYRPHLSYFWANICNFRDPNLVTFYLNEFTHFLHWMENTLSFIYSTNILVRLLTVNMKNCFTPKNQKMFYPILVTLLKMRPHYSQSSREDVAPSSGTSPLALIRKYPPPGADHASEGPYLRKKHWTRTTSYGGVLNNMANTLSKKGLTLSIIACEPVMNHN